MAFLNSLVLAYRPVVAVTPQTDVLSCGHERARVDLTAAGTHLRELGLPRFARTRLCPQCRREPNPKALAKVTHDPTPVSRQRASDWGQLTRTEREQAEVILQALPGGADIKMDGWLTMDPEQRATIAQIGERFAAGLGLTFREFMGLRVEPAPYVTAAGLRRLQASPKEKERRREASDIRWLAAERARKG
ncbi:hypothetical protein [Deinococcus sp. Leaf326]|uniref:hypothetical protein n=1 Tax=Deinococcus sp. Leaf326 TaxID=1736338 RepID=UPI0006F8243A|nr:hypothetical protein [Deinococcus sp. Leaf326]KQR01759.1 hypothetical protein ASF71_21575 [Deinococcus sp. Leaf326]